MNIEPLMDRLIVKEVAVDEGVLSGLVIPNTSYDKPLKGVVLAAGPGLDGKPMSVSKGDTIIYGRKSGTEIDYEGENIVIMRELDVYAILKKDDK